MGEGEAVIDTGKAIRGNRWSDKKCRLFVTFAIDVCVSKSGARGHRRRWPTTRQ